MLYNFYYIAPASLFFNFETGALPFTTLVALMLLWFGVSVPLTFIGSYFGFSKATYELPCKAHQIPRQIPDQAWFMHPIISMVIGGLLPFGM